MGIGAAAAVTYAWTKMTFIGDPEYDLDLSAAATAAATGDVSFADLFSGEMGTKFLILTAVGAGTGLTAPYVKAFGRVGTMAAGVGFGAYRAYKSRKQKKADAEKKAKTSAPDTVKNPNPKGRKKTISRQSAVRWVAKTKGNKVAIKYAKSLQEGILLEGGAAGHMNHPFDDRDITFGDMKQMIRLSLEGKLNIESGVQEKTDGQALAITFKDGKVRAARNKTELRNPLNPKQVKMKFADRGEIQNAFTFAMLDLEKALLKISKLKLDEIFQNGARFLNIEIIYPGTKNVIMYGPKAYIQFHGVDEYDLLSATKIDSYPEYAPLLQKMIADVNAHVQKQFEIIPPKILTIKQLPDFEKKEKYFIDQVTYLQKQFQLKDTDELVMWHEAWWKGKIEQTIPYATEDIKLGLLKRWAYFDKSFRMNNKTIPDPETLQMAKEFDKQDFAKQNKHNVYNFEKIFLELGVEILHNISDYLSVVPTDAVKDIRKRISSKIKIIQNSKDLTSLDKLKFELKRIEDLGGFEKLVPSEGIVFVYKDKTYKLTGLFAPINQLLGIGGLADK